MGQRPAGPCPVQSAATWSRACRMRCNSTIFRSTSTIFASVRPLTSSQDVCASTRSSNSSVISLSQKPGAVAPPASPRARRTAPFPRRPRRVVPLVQSKGYPSLLLLRKKYTLRTILQSQGEGRGKSRGRCRAQELFHFLLVFLILTYRRDSKQEGSPTVSRLMNAELIGARHSQVCAHAIHQQNSSIFWFTTSAMSKKCGRNSPVSRISGILG